MPTPTQAQLALERDALKADIADKQALYNRMIAKGQVNSAQELLGDINKLNGQERALSNDIQNFTQFSADRAAADAEIAQTQNFETKNAPANQTVTSSSTTSTTTGGTATTTIGGAFSLTPEAKAASKNETLRAQAFNADPTGRFGPNTIDRAASSGAITAEEAAALRAGAIPEAERNAIATAAQQASLAAAKAGTVQAPTNTTVTPTPNSSGNTTVEQQSVATPPPSINSNSNLTNTATIVTNPDGTKSEVTVNNTTATVTTTPIVDNQLVQGTETTIVASQNVDNTNPALINPNTDPPPPPEPVPVVTQPVVPVIAPDPPPNFAPVVAPATLPDNPGLDDGPQIPNPIKSVSQEIPIGNQTTTVITPADPVNQPSNLQIANVNVISTGVQGPKNETIAQATTQDADNANTQGDWRVRLSLAPNSTYLYNAKHAGILAYLKDTNGVVFPYVPQIQVTYAANYETADIVHNNYKMVQYKNSSVDQITITGDFTAQDTYEANYMLAVIHFFRSVTKMFYGKDQIPKPGTPPPLCYLSGLGDFQFDYHPLVISSFNYNLPNDVDYIRASSPTLGSGVDSTAYNAKGGTPPITETRLGVLNTGATASPPNFGNFKATNTQPTYVPTKMSISITAFPMVTRNDISNRFSVKDYATGKLLQGRKNPGGGGIW